jgi:hypothetical protein
MSETANQHSESAQRISDEAFGRRLADSLSFSHG